MCNPSHARRCFHGRRAALESRPKLMTLFHLFLLPHYRFLLKIFFRAAAIIILTLCRSLLCQMQSGMREFVFKGRQELFQEARSSSFATSLRSRSAKREEKPKVKGKLSLIYQRIPDTGNSSTYGRAKRGGGKFLSSSIFHID
jgi:hypothetical protein